jgi:hypothetical protein
MVSLSASIMANNNTIEKKKYTREDIARRIIDHGDLLVIYSNKIYRLNAWIKHHPGGEMVILHMIGRVRLTYITKKKKINFRMQQMKSMLIIQIMSYVINYHYFILVILLKETVNIINHLFLLFNVCRRKMM